MPRLRRARAAVRLAKMKAKPKVKAAGAHIKKNRGVYGLAAGGSAGIVAGGYRSKKQRRKEVKAAYVVGRVHQLQHQARRGRR